MPKSDGSRPRQAYRMLIEAVYRRWNREKLADVADLMDKYEGQEAEIYDKIARKYVFNQEEQHWKPLIVAMYRRFSPAKLPGLEPILAKYRSSEAALYRALCDKYVPTVRRVSELSHQVDALEGREPVDGGNSSGSDSSPLLAEAVGCVDREVPASPKTPAEEPGSGEEAWEAQQAARALGVSREVLGHPAASRAPTAPAHEPHAAPLSAEGANGRRSASGELPRGGRHVPERSPSRYQSGGHSPLREPSPPRRQRRPSPPPRPPSPPQRRSPRRLSRRRRASPARASPQRPSLQARRRPSPRRQSDSRRAPRHSGRRSSSRRASPISPVPARDQPSEGHSRRSGSDDRGVKRPRQETFASQAKSRRKQREVEASREELKRVEAARIAEAVLDRMDILPDLFPTESRDDRRDDRRSPASPEAAPVLEDDDAVRDAVDEAFGDILPDLLLGEEPLFPLMSPEREVAADEPVISDKAVRAAERQARREACDGTGKRKRRKVKPEGAQDAMHAVASPFDAVGAGPEASPTDAMVSDAIAAAAAHAAVLTGNQVRVRRRRKKAVVGPDGELILETDAPKVKKKKKKKVQLQPEVDLQGDPRNREIAEDGQAPAGAVSSKKEETREMLLQKMQALKRSTAGRTRAANIRTGMAPATRPKAGFPPAPRVEVPEPSEEVPDEESASDSPTPVPEPPEPPVIPRPHRQPELTEPPPGVWHTDGGPPRVFEQQPPAAGVVISRASIAGSAAATASELDRRQVHLRGAREAELRKKALNLIAGLRPVRKALS